jgi:hypothetical protein
VFAGARDLLTLTTSKDATSKDRLDATLAVVSDVLPAVAYVAPADWPQVNYDAFNRLVVVARKYVDIIGSKERQQLPELVVDVTTLATAIGDAGFQHVVLPAQAVAAIDFASNVATATDANGVQAALEHAAAPTDAFTRKRVRVPGESWGYVTVNAYGGGTIGRETATNPALSSGVPATQAGLYMPLGVEVGVKELLRPWGMHPGISAGIFAQLVDLGQVATWRLTAKDSAVKSDPPAFKLQNVFSPGLFAVVHVPGFPLTLGGGRSWAPRFRELTLTTLASGGAATPARADVWRTSAFLAVDVTIR